MSGADGRQVSDKQAMTSYHAIYGSPYFDYLRERIEGRLDLAISKLVSKTTTTEDMRFLQGQVDALKTMQRLIFMDLSEMDD
jgi:hypothetical protein